MSNPTFKTNFLAGSLKDQISGDLLTNNGAEFKQTWKGLAMYFDGSSSLSVVDPSFFEFWQPFSVVAFAKDKKKAPYENSIIYITTLGYPHDNVILIASASLIRSHRFMVRNYIANAVNSYWALGSEKIGQWRSYIITYDGTTVKFILDWVVTVSQAFTFSNPIGTGLFIDIWVSSGNRYQNWETSDVGIYNHALSQTEINNLYEEFLARSPLSTAIRHFNYPRPTRLNEDGLVCAYNMQPSEWWILVDTSWNNNQGTINWPLSSMDWLAFDGVDDYVNIDSSIISQLNTSTGTFSMTLASNAVSDWAFRDIINFQNAGNTEYIHILKRNTWGIQAVCTKAWVVQWNLYTTDFVFVAWQIYTISLVQDWISPKIYVSWISQALTISTSTDLTAWFSDLSLLTEAYISKQFFWKWEIQDVKIYNNIRTPKQIKDYHNARASQKTFSDDLRYLECDWPNVNPLWRTIGTGLWKGVDETSWNPFPKYFESTSSWTFKRPFWDYKHVDMRYYAGSWEHIQEDRATFEARGRVNESNGMITATINMLQRVASIDAQKGIVV